MISLKELKAAMPSPVEISFNDGVVVVAELISVDEDASSQQIWYTPLKVLHAPPGSSDRPGAYLAVSESAVRTWRVYTGPRDWETKSEHG